MRKQIKARAFQEPIHEDAPGFNPNQGHQNLITELNEEVLPSYATDLIGTATASPDVYQFRLNAAGQLEFFANGEWNTIKAGGGMTDTPYTPTHKAVIQVEAAFASDCFVYFDLETDKSFSGRDFRVHQYGLERACNVYTLKPGSTPGSVVYRITAEATLQAGINELEIKYGDANAEYKPSVPWTLLDEYDLMQGAFAYADGYACVRPKNLPDYIPRINDWTQANSFGSTAIATNLNQQSNTWNFPQQYWNANKKAWVTPRVSGYWLDPQGDAANSWDTYPAKCINIRQHGYGSSSVYAYFNIRLKEMAHGNLYGMRVSHQSWPNSDLDGFLVYGLLNNGWWLLGEYKHLGTNWNGKSLDIPLTYAMQNGTLLQWELASAENAKRDTWANVAATYGGAPNLRVFIPLLAGTIGLKDEAL